MFLFVCACSAGARSVIHAQARIGLRVSCKVTAARRDRTRVNSRPRACMWNPEIEGCLTSQLHKANHRNSFHYIHHVGSPPMCNSECDSSPTEFCMAMYNIERSKLPQGPTREAPSPLQPAFNRFSTSFKPPSINLAFVFCKG